MTSAPEMLTVQEFADDGRLAQLIADRERTGEARFDEWWNGVYRIVTGPRINHGQLIVRLGVLLLPLADDRGLDLATPVNIGINKSNARVPDIAAVRPDVEMTSPAFAATAELVVEILSPREVAGEKLDFYAEWNVNEYLEVDLSNGTCRLLANRDGNWESVTHSETLGFDLAAIELLLAG